MVRCVRTGVQVKLLIWALGERDDFEQLAGFLALVLLLLLFFEQLAGFVALVLLLLLLFEQLAGFIDLELLAGILVHLLLSFEELLQFVFFEQPGTFDVTLKCFVGGRIVGCLREGLGC